jgi:hypothetical protein
MEAIGVTPGRPCGPRFLYHIIQLKEQTMSTTLEPEPQFELGRTGSTSAATTAADRIRHNFAACRIKFKWFGTSKTLSTDQKSQAAESFGADGDSISAGKKLIDTKHDAYKALTSIKSQINRFWKENSLPYPEPGIRLIRQEHIEGFNTNLEELSDQLAAAVRMLDDNFAEIKTAARQRLGELYNDSDYPTTLDDLFAVEWDFPSVDPPSYLRQLNPELYEEQARRVAQRFERAVEMAEQAFMEELDQLVNHLAERMSGNEDGRPRIFRDSAVTNLGEFFSRFRELNVRSNDQLDELVGRCEQLMTGVQPQGLRDNDSLRRSLSTNLSTVQSSLDQMLVDRPRRNIIRPTRSEAENG